MEKPLRQCKCDDPLCRKCLVSNCVDDDCKVHKKAAKIKVKEERLKEVERQIGNLMGSGYSFRETMGFRSEMGDLRIELDRLNGVEPELHVSYKYGFEPDAGRIRHFIGILMDRLPVFEIIVSMVSILAIIGLISIIRWIFF